MHVVIFSGGNIEKGKAVEHALGHADLIIAADSGAEAAVRFGVSLSYVLGDFDSLSQRIKRQLEHQHVEFVTFHAEKDETDTELAVLFALQQGATSIAILGGVAGNRIDHVVANMFLTFHPDIQVRFINGNQVSWITKGPNTEEIAGNTGDLLSLLPLSEMVEGITTTHLQYQLNQGTLYLGKSRGISNVFTSDTVVVSFQHGVILFVHTLTETSK